MSRRPAQRLLCCLLVPVACGCTIHHFGKMVDAGLEQPGLAWDSAAPLSASPSVGAFPAPAFDYLVLEEYRAVEGCSSISALDSSFQTLRPEGAGQGLIRLERDIPGYGTLPAQSLLGGMAPAVVPAGAQRAYEVLEAQPPAGSGSLPLPGTLHVYYKSEDLQGFLKYDFQPGPDGEQVRLTEAQKRLTDGHTYITEHRCSFQYRPDLAWFIPAGYAVLDYRLAGAPESRLERQARATSAEDRAGAVALVSQGLGLYQSGDLDAAAVLFYQALDLDPGNADGQFQLGQTLEKLHMGYAAWHYRQAMRWRPGSEAAAQAKSRLDELNARS